MLFTIFYKCKKNISDFCKCCVFFSYLCFSAIFTNKLIFDNTNYLEKNDYDKNEENNNNINILMNSNNSNKYNEYNEYNYQLCYVCKRYINNTMFLFDDKTFCNQMCRKKYSSNLIK
jgi:hypothetical protein